MLTNILLLNGCLLLLMAACWYVFYCLCSLAGIKITSTPSHISIRTQIGWPYFQCTLEADDIGCSLTHWSFNGSILVASSKYTISPVSNGFGLRVQQLVTVSDAGVYTCELNCAGGEMKQASHYLIYYRE